MPSIELPLDRDGFLRRECSRCEGQFKLHYGPTDDRPGGYVEGPLYFCPLCGEPGDPNSFWTAEQARYAEAAVVGEALREFGETFKSLGTAGGGLVEISVSGAEQPEPPEALMEDDDMLIAAPPCHEWEPIKVSEDWAAPLHCLLCGEPFALG